MVMEHTRVVEREDVKGPRKKPPPLTARKGLSRGPIQPLLRHKGKV